MKLVLDGNFSGHLALRVRRADEDGWTTLAAGAGRRWADDPPPRAIQVTVDGDGTVWGPDGLLHRPTLGDRLVLQWMAYSLNDDSRVLDSWVYCGFCIGWVPWSDQGAQERGVGWARRRRAIEDLLRKRGGEKVLDLVEAVLSGLPERK